MPPTTETSGTGRAARWIGGLDGLRAVAVIAVVLFHLNPGYLSAGFLGVDLFFVISGYLITRLLLAERSRTGRIGLGRFYLRRARRLLPAVLALLAVVGVAGYLLWPDQRPTLPGGVASSLGYVTNWWMIADQQSYFVAMGRPPMLQHLWSLAIEEQFYLLWAPVVVILSAPWVARTRLKRPAFVIAGAALLLAACSTVAMAVIAIRGNVPYEADSSRVYFGTDTHAMGLLIGAAAGALATVPWRSLTRGAPRWVRPAWRASWQPRPLLPAWLVGSPVDDGRASSRGVSRRRDDGHPASSGSGGALGGTRGPLPVWVTDAGAVLGLAALVTVFVTVDEYLPGLYRGGFALFALLAAATICAVARPGSLVGRLLDARPLRWLGQRSYGIYLWHWPVLVVTRPGYDVQGPAWLIDLARTGLVLVVAALSYRYLELPIRRGEFSLSWKRAASSLRALVRPAATARLGVGSGPRPPVAAPPDEGFLAGLRGAVVPHRRVSARAAAVTAFAALCAAVLVVASVASPRSDEAASVPTPAPPVVVTPLAAGPVTAAPVATGRPVTTAPPVVTAAPLLTFPTNVTTGVTGTDSPTDAVTNTSSAPDSASRSDSSTVPGNAPAGASASPASPGEVGLTTALAPPLPPSTTLAPSLAPASSSTLESSSVLASSSTTAPSPAPASPAALASSSTAASATAPVTTAHTSGATPPSTTVQSTTVQTTAVQTTTVQTTKATAPAAVSAFGDSVLLGAAPAVKKVVGSLTVDAVVGRQAWDTLKAVTAAQQAKSLAAVVLIHTGNNGIIAPKQLAATLAALGDRTRVVLVNDHVDRSWQGPNNKTIAAAAAKFSNVVLVDWNAAAAKNPAWLGPDGIHVNGTGAKAYAALIAHALG